MENEEFIREFLDESEENLDQLDQDFVSLEQDPHDHERLDSIYRAIHTIKGTSGFFGFSKLGAVAHAAENLLSRLRDGEVTLDARLTSALLDSVDAIRDILANIATDADEGDGDYRELNRKLEDLSASAVSSQTRTDVTERFEADAPVEDASPPDDNASAVIAGRCSKIDGHIQPPENLAVVELLPTLGVTKQLADHLTDEIETGGNATRKTAESTDGSGTAISPDLANFQAMGSDRSIRVDVELLNQLMDLVGELVLARNQLLQTERSEHDSRLTDVTQQVNRITTELQERVMQTRMQPIGNIWSKFPRVVRDLAVMCGKEVELVMDGADTEVDKSLLEAIKDPLTHLIRNAIDHGIESAAERISLAKEKKGALRLRAWHQGGKVNVEIKDDGRGIDPEAVRAKAIANKLISADEAGQMDNQQLVQLIFRPGFSTAPEVTGVSGRGVGMDVVKTNIESIGGTIEVESRIGIGTSITVKIPLTLAILPALVISSSEQLFAIPQSHLVEMLRVDMNDPRDRVERLRDSLVYRLRGELLPIVHLSQVLGVESLTSDAQHVNIVVLQIENSRFGLVIDHVERMEEIVVKPLNPLLRVIPHFAGATVMGDGSVAFILDIVGLATNLGLSLDEPKRSDQFVNRDQAEVDKTQMLLVRLLSGRELAVALSEVDRLEEIPFSTIERSNHGWAVQYRGQIMPLMPLSAFLGEPAQEGVTGQSLVLDEGIAVKALVININGSHTAFVVHEILDIAEQEGPIRMANRPENNICGTTVIHGKITDVLDLQSVLRRSGFPQDSYSTVTR